LKVRIAGFNIEKVLIDNLTPELRTQATPEVISAAYARLSRDPRSIEAVRRDARNDVERARKSNERIVFQMGHASIAEHAVFNIDISGISRLAVEAIEHFRLASFTEKSQRYIKLGKDVMVPEELKEVGLEEEFNNVISRLYDAYREIYRALVGSGYEVSVAKEDARYVMPLATTAQLGMTINARELEYMMSRLSAHPLTELRKLSKELERKASKVAPSLIRYPEASEYVKDTDVARRYIESVVRKKVSSRLSGKTSGDVNLIDYTRDGDKKIAASLIFSSCDCSMKEAMKVAGKMSKKEIIEIVARTFDKIHSYDSVWREFETSYLTFELLVSASCYAQLKRHRMATIIAQDYDTGLGVRIPPSILSSGLKRVFINGIKEAERFYRRLKKKLPSIADYILTNAHRRRVLINLNMREMYHFSRLRSDSHAQWEIREISEGMCRFARKVMPLSAILLAGKDEFEDTRIKLNKILKDNDITY